MPTVKHAVCIGLSGSTVQSTIVYGVQRVVYVKSSKVLTATSCLLLIAMKFSMR